MIGKRIKQLRTEKGITQNDLSKHIGLTPKMISFYELGERFPPYDIILNLSEYFNVSTDYLLGKTNTPISYGSSSIKTFTEEEEEIINDYRLLDKYEKRIVKGRISELLYNKQIEKSSPKNESSDELLDVNFKDRVNK